ncbi:type II secretion system F family protein [Aureliella helgolandensis]|uniref:General secretion pathway protein F n=1 Tax=Aureliella helgolandensis TaxID=2527968 RepID=A0A518G340_9BACT|nr:type II secretion system F family protein [Aureliella helgolandensis]QDV22985.1 Type II secretion system protein F [Aureliella helgolandensis]
MPDYAYVARDMRGQRKTGVLTANSQRDVLSMLDGMSLMPVEITPAKGSGDARSKRVSGQVMANAYNQLASLLRSGVPLMRALTVMSSQASKPALKAVLVEIKSKVEEGEPLPVAMARFPRVFNDMAVNMVRAGTEGGFLEDALERVAAFTEQQEDMKGRAAGALAYPVFLGCVGTAVVTVLIIFFVPKFEPLFATLREKGQLPAATDMLLAFSAFLQNYWWLLIATICIGLFSAVSFLRTDKGKYWLDWAKIKFPLFGSIFLSLAVARFCRVLGTLLNNGVPILRSLEISRAAAGNRILSASIKKASENITAGEKLATPLAASGHFPNQVVEMISVAEESNSLDRVMIQISDSLERTTFRRMDMLVRLLEPMMLLLMAGVVFFIVLALMVPLLNSSGAV